MDGMLRISARRQPFSQDESRYQVFAVARLALCSIALSRLWLFEARSPPRFPEISMQHLVRLCPLLLTTTLVACNSGGDDGGPGGAGGDGGTGGTAACNLDYAAIAAADTTPVSLAEDVMPIFQGACNFQSCHDMDRRPTPLAQLALGPRSSTATEAQLQSVLDNLINVASATAPEARRVVPGDPGASFLVQKMAGTHDEQGYACTPQDVGATGCGTAMPPASAPFCESDRFNVIVRWIAQLTDEGTPDGG
jgi:hypothetical protein